MAHVPLFFCLLSTSQCCETNNKLEAIQSSLLPSSCDYIQQPYSNLFLSGKPHSLKFNPQASKRWCIWPLPLSSSLIKDERLDSETHLQPWTEPHLHQPGVSSAMARSVNYSLSLSECHPLLPLSISGRLQETKGKPKDPRAHFFPLHGRWPLPLKTLNLAETHRSKQRQHHQAETSLISLSSALKTHPNPSRDFPLSPSQDSQKGHVWPCICGVWPSQMAWPEPFWPGLWTNCNSHKQLQLQRTKNSTSKRGFWQQRQLQQRRLQQ